MIGNTDNRGFPIPASLQDLIFFYVIIVCFVVCYHVLSCKVAKFFFIFSCLFEKVLYLCSVLVR